MQTPPPLIDWNDLIKTAIYTISGTFGALKSAGLYFKDKEKQRIAKENERVEFIQKIAETTTNKTLEKAFMDMTKSIEKSVGELSKNIDILFKYREEDRKHYDTRLDSLINPKK